ncbi:GPP34 family phosphoprotein [bacterium]|nr:GPP34 family phosphoprotein [bacterium]
MADMQLHLHEEMLLLLLKDEEGTFHNAWRHIALGAALLSELLLDGYARVEETKRGREMVISATEASPINPILAECHAAIATAKKPCVASHWVSKFGNQRDLAQRIAEGLAERGILRIDRESILLIFKRTIFPEIDHKPEEQLMQRIWGAIHSTDAVDPRTAVIVGLAQHTGLMRQLFDKSALKTHKERIEALANGNAAVSGAKEAVQAAQAAIMVATIMPAIVATTVVSH